MIIIDEKIKYILKQLKEHSEESYYHSLRVAIISKLIIEEYYKDKNIDKECLIQYLETTYVGGLLHDCGKIKIPLSILHKNGPLTSKEFENIKKHVIYGKEIIKNSNLKNKEQLARIVYEHHEREDGSGYPENKTKLEINEISKVVALADSYDAMKSRRCYKTEKNNEDIIKELIICKLRYDNRYLEILINLIKNEEILNEQE